MGGGGGGIVFWVGRCPIFEEEGERKPGGVRFAKKTFLHQSEINWLGDIAKSEYCNFIFVFGEFLSSLSFFGREAIRGIKSGEKMKKHGLVLMGRKGRESVYYSHAPPTQEREKSILFPTKK